MNNKKIGKETDEEVLIQTAYQNMAEELMIPLLLKGIVFLSFAETASFW